MSERTVLEKLGFRPGMVARVSGMPDDMSAILRPARATEGQGDPDWHLLFVADAAGISDTARDFVPGYRRGQHLWVAYPKRTSGIRTDISRDRGWERLEAMDLLPVTQISLGPVWSALRWRYRDEIRTITRRF